MIKRTPQEIADFFQCYVAQDENGLWYINGCKPELKIEKGYWKPQRTPDDFEINIFSILVSAPADHDWTHLYEPRKADNAPHQSEVFIHKEYRIVKAHKEINPEAFAQGVAVWLNSGWKPCGGIAFDKDGCPYQAMVRGV